MKSLTAAGVGLFVGVTAMWIGGDRLKALVLGDTCCPTHTHGETIATPLTPTNAATPPTPTTTISDAAQIVPWEPVDESFRGCEQSCGSRAQAAEDGVLVQTTTSAKVGDKVYCLVSGVVFEVNEHSAHRDVDGKRYYFCCESCAAYFSANQAHVLAARGVVAA